MPPFGIRSKCRDVHQSIRINRPLLFLFPQKSDGILCQNMRIQNHLPRPNVCALSDEPEKQNKQAKSPGNERGIVHRCGVNGHAEGETEDDDEDDDVGACDAVDNKSSCPLHPEPARCHVSPPGKKMREDGHDVRESGEDDKGAHESRKCGGGAHVDAAENRREDPTKDYGAERVVLAVVNVREELAERRSSIAS